MIINRLKKIPMRDKGCHLVSLCITVLAPCKGLWIVFHWKSGQLLKSRKLKKTQVLSKETWWWFTGMMLQTGVITALLPARTSVITRTLTWWSEPTGWWTLRTHGWALTGFVSSKPTTATTQGLSWLFTAVVLSWWGPAPVAAAWWTTVKATTKTTAKVTAWPVSPTNGDTGAAAK